MNFCSGIVGSRSKPRLARLLLPLLLIPQFSAAQQSSTPSESTESPAPVLTGVLGAVPTVEAGHPNFVLIGQPVLLVPFGEKWLFESRVKFEADIQRPADGEPYDVTVATELGYMQLDYIANKYVTITGGRYLTPFGMYNERLYPIWIRKLQTEPLILPIEESSSNGIMVRGGIAVNPQIDINYAAYFSAPSTVNKFEADRAVGGRFGFFFPQQRFEIGGSFLRLLQDSEETKAGAHFEWQPMALPLDIRAEYAHQQAGHGYWIEGAYRFTQLQAASLRKFELASRVQQFFTGNAAALADAPDLPQVRTTQAEIGVNYYFRDDWKATASYGRQFSDAGNANIWTIGMTYRFVISLARKWELAK